MISFKNITNVSFTILLTLIGFGKNDYPVNIQSENGVSVPSYHLSESGATPLPSTGDILGFYTDINAANPKQIDIVSFANKNGLPTSIVNTGQAVNVSPINGLFPSNHSAFDFANRDLVCLITGEEFMLTYDDQGCLIGPVVNLAPLSPAAPQYFNNSLYGILVENNGNGSGPDVDFEIVNNIQTGIVDGVIPWNFTPPPGYTFRHEFMSSATNGVDELYFVSGANLIIYTDPVPPGSNPVIPIDLDPSNQFFYYGIEYKSPDILWALKANAIAQTLELVEIDIKNNTSPPPMTTLYDLQANVLPGPDGTILNVDNYSTTLDTCQMKYYFSTVYDHTNSSSRLIEIDVPKISHMQQINPLYLFGIEIKSLSCENCTAEFNFTSIDSCGNVQFNSNAAGIGNFTYTWDFGDPASGANNTSTLANPSHDYTACGMYNVSLTVECPDGTIWTVIQTVTISDAIPPNIVCPPHLNLKCDDDLSPAFTGTATATDNCLIIQPLTYSDDTLFMIPCDGLVERTWTATDWCGNTSSCIQNIVVRDNVPPILLNCPPSMTIYGTLDSLGVCTANAIIISPTGTDNCSAGVNVTNNINGSGSVSGTYPIGSTTITWTATDSCMNTAVCNTIITVSCDTCSCVGFDNLQFYNSPGTNFPGFSLPVTCGSMPAYTLPCIASDGLYQFSGNFQCSDSCTAQVNYEIISLDDGSMTTGYVTTYPLGGSYYHFDIISGIHPPPGNYQLVLTGSCNADTCLCIINFIVPPCIDCECGSYTDINYRPVPGAPNQNAICGDTLGAQCNASFPWTLNGNFLCTGTDCPDSTQISWILTHPDGSVIVDSTVASPGFNVLIQGTSFDTSGLYQLSIQAICGLDTCVCDFVIEVACDDCCDDLDAFCSIFENEVNIIIDDPYCKATVDIGDLGTCSNFIEYIEWGDTFIDNGPFGSNTMIMHTYPGSGTYEIKWLAYGLDNSGNYCIEKEFLDTIYLNCPAIICCEEEEAFNMRILGNIEFVVDDENKRVDLMIGDINECDSISIRTWGDPHINLSEKKWGRGSIVSYNYDECSFYNIEYLAEAHQNDTTVCIEKLFEKTINILCTDCPCEASDIQELSDAVDNGFATISSSLNCTVCLAPLELSDCEIVEWYEGSVNSLPLGTTNGTQTFCYDFVNSGSYSVIMLVKRYRPDGNICEVFIKEQVINANCSTVPACDISAFPNPGFDEGAVSGGLGENGMGSCNGWTAENGNPIVVEGEAGSLDGWSVMLDDESGEIDVLTSIEPVCLEKSSGIMKVRFGIKTNGIKSTLRHRPRVWTLVDNRKHIDLSPLNIGEWYDIEIPYDLSTIMTEDSCGGGVPIQAAFWAYGVNPTARRTTVIIDEVCIDHEVIVSTVNLENTLSLGIFPNPTAGEFSIRFGDQLSDNSQIQVFDILGRIIQSKNLSRTSSEEVISLSDQPNGVYIIKLLQDGKTSALRKILKQ